MTRRAKRRAIFLVSLLALIVIGVVLVQFVRDIQRSRMLTQHREEGMKAYHEGDYPIAIERLSHYNANLSTDPEALIYFGHARALVPAEGHLDQAIFVTTQGLAEMDAGPASEFDKELYEQGQRRLLEWHQTVGRHVEVVSIADRLLEDHPNDVDVLGAKVISLAARRQFEESIPVISRLIELEPENVSWYDFKLHVLGGLETPESELLDMTQGWTASYDKDGRFHILRADLLLRLNDLVGAEEEMKIAEKMGYQDPEVLRFSVMVLDRLGQFNNADSALNKAIELTPNDQQLYEVTVRRYWRANRIEEANKTIALAEENFDKLSDRLIRDKILLGMFSADRDGSRALLEETIADLEGPEDEARKLWYEAILARMLMNENNVQEVLDALLTARRLNAGDPVVYYLMGELHEIRGETAEALNAYATAREMDPRWLGANVAHARALMQAGRHREAMPIARYATRAAPQGMVEPFLLYAKILLEVERTNKSLGAIEDPRQLNFVISNLEELQELVPDNPDLSPLLANSYLLLDDPDSARDIIMRRLDDSQSPYQELIELASISEREGIGLDRQLVDEARRRGTPTQFTVLLAANRLASEGQVNDGLDLLDASIGRLPENSPDLRDWRRLRTMYLMQWEHEDAEESLSQLIAVYPHDVDIQVIAANSLEFSSSPELAAQVLANLRRELGDDAQVVRLVEASALLSSPTSSEKDLAEATVMIQDVLDKDPDSELGLVLLTRASLAGDNPSHDRAIRALTELVTLYPDNPKRLVKLIELQQYAGNFDEASTNLSLLSRMANDNPRLMRTELLLLHSQGDLKTLTERIDVMDTPDASLADRVLMARLLSRIGDTQRARVMYEPLLGDDATPASLIAGSEFYGGQGEVDKGLELLDRLDDDGSSLMVPMAYGVYYCKFKDSADAVPYFDSAIERDPENARLYGDIASQLLRAGRPDLALQKARAGLKIDPDHSALQERMALALLELGGDPEEVRSNIVVKSRTSQLLFDALELINSIPREDDRWQPDARHLAQISQIVGDAPEHPVLWRMAIAMHRDAGKLERGWDLAQQAASRFPTQAEPLRLATSISMSRSKWDQAKADAEAWRSRVPGNTLEPDLFMAQCEMKLGNPEQALALLSPHQDRLLEVVEARPFDVSLLIDAMAQSGNYEEAKVLVTPLLAQDERWVLSWLGVSRSLDPEQAADAILLTEEHGGDSLNTNRAMMRAWVNLSGRSGDPMYREKAMLCAERISDDPETSVEANLNMAQLAKKDGDDERAISLYRIVLKQDPENVVALNNLAMMLLEKNQVEEALKLSNRAVALYPDASVLLDTQGQILCANGEFDKSIEALSKAVALSPDQLSYRLSYVKCLLEAGRIHEAETVLRKGRSNFINRDALPASQRALLESLESQIHEIATGGTR